MIRFYMSILSCFILALLTGCSNNASHEITKKPVEVELVGARDSVKVDYTSNSGDSNVLKRDHFEQIIKGHATAP